MILMRGPAVVNRVGEFQSIDGPGIWMSENNSAMSERDSSIASASSALTASTAVKPGVLHDVYGAHPQDHLVFDTKTLVVGIAGSDDIGQPSLVC